MSSYYLIISAFATLVFALAKLPLQVASRDLHSFRHYDSRWSVEWENSNVILHCAAGKAVTHIKFASYGKAHLPRRVQAPKGERILGRRQRVNRRWFGHKHARRAVSCHAKHSKQIVDEMCVGKNLCSIPVNYETFGDPCWGRKKYLAVEYVCTSSSSSSSSEHDHDDDDHHQTNSSHSSSSNLPACCSQFPHHDQSKSQNQCEDTQTHH